MIGGDQDSYNKEEDDGETFPLPGFRFHPTDEELVGFYLSRKVQKKSIKLEIIKHVDIYKFDPWDLPRWSNTENESYFFCRRGRKYRNSIRPNRVTGSGFWKATGIDKPIYSDTTNKPESSIIGLKKTLVYYRGSAGKGTKTDWMMHEFRLPATNDNTHAAAVFNHSDDSKTTSNNSEEAEVWTLCRIFKRSVSSRKYTPDWRELVSNKRVKPHPTNTSSDNSNGSSEAYCNFVDPNNSNVIPCFNRGMSHMNQSSFNQAPSTTMPPGPTIELSNVVEDNDHVFSYGNWDELRSVVEFALEPSSL